MNIYKKYLISILIILSIFLIQPPAFGGYFTDDTGMTYTLYSLSLKFPNAIMRSGNVFVFKDNIIISPKDKLFVSNKAIILYDTANKQSMLVVKGALEIEDNSEITINSGGFDFFIKNDADLGKKKNLINNNLKTGLIYEDIASRRQAKRTSKAILSSSPAQPRSTNQNTQVTIIVKDADTLKPIPAQIEILDSNGDFVYMKDLDGKDLKYVKFNSFWVDEGISYKGTLPSGNTCITVSQGYEYIPYYQEIAFQPGESLTIEVRLEKVVDMNAKGWYAGDMHIHIQHSAGTYKLGIPFCAPIVKGMGFDWMAFSNEWRTYDNPLIPSEELNATCKHASYSSFLCLWGMEAPKTDLGHLVSMGYDRWEDLKSRDEKPYFRTIPYIEDLGGVAIYTHPQREDFPFTDYKYGEETFFSSIARELPFDLLAIPQYIQNIDLLTDTTSEWMLHEDFWYTYLNHGYRIGCSGFSDGYMNRPINNIAHCRTYVYVNGVITKEKIVEAFKKQHTLATSGPLILFTIDDKYIPGDIIPADGKQHTAQVKVSCADKLGHYIRKIYVKRNDSNFQVYNFENQTNNSFEFSFTISEDMDSWYVIKCVGTDNRIYGQMALTSPIFFESKQYVPPSILTANVKGRIFDQDSGVPLPGTVEVYYLNKLIKTESVNDGTFSMTIPAASVIKVKYKDFEPVEKSIISGNESLRYHLLKIKGNDLSDWKYYSEIVDLCKQVNIGFPIFGTDSRVSEKVLIPKGAVWKYLDDGSNEGAAWAKSNFNDSYWKFGTAVFGYGKRGLNTTVGYGPDVNNKYVTTYFRTVFSVPDISSISSLVVNLKRDDGAVVYLNGREIIRSNMPLDRINYDTFAFLGVVGDEEKRYFNFLVNKEYLVGGKNVLAVEIHRDVQDSDDILFDLELKARGIFQRAVSSEQLSIISEQ